MIALSLSSIFVTEIHQANWSVGAETADHSVGRALILGLCRVTLPSPANITLCKVSLFYALGSTMRAGLGNSLPPYNSSTPLVSGPVQQQNNPSSRQRDWVCVRAHSRTDGTCILSSVICIYVARQSHRNRNTGNFARRLTLYSVLCSVDGNPRWSECRDVQHQRHDPQETHRTWIESLARLRNIMRQAQTNKQRLRVPRKCRRAEKLKLCTSRSLFSFPTIRYSGLPTSVFSTSYGTLTVGWAKSYDSRNRAHDQGKQET